MRKPVGVVLIAIIGLNLLDNSRTVALECNCCFGFKGGRRREAEEASSQNTVQETTQNSESTTLKDLVEEARFPSTDPSGRKSKEEEEAKDKVRDAHHCTTDCDKPETCQAPDVKFCYTRSESHHSGAGTTWGCATEERMRELKDKCKEIKDAGFQCQVTFCETDRCNTAEAAPALPSPSSGPDGRSKSVKTYFNWVLFTTTLYCVLQVF